MPTGNRGLDAAVEWGGPVWARQAATGIDWLGDVQGLRVLEIGTRRGGMAIWLARAGATVTALDIVEEPLSQARQSAQAAGVADRTTFATYSGRPDDLPTGFDVVFSKSTLVLLPPSEAFPALARSLVPGGRLLALENAQGPWWLHGLRMIRRRSLRPHSANYFTPATVRLVGEHLTVELERWTQFPPTVLIGARKA